MFCARTGSTIKNGVRFSYERVAFLLGPVYTIRHAIHFINISFHSKTTTPVLRSRSHLAPPGREHCCFLDSSSVTDYLWE